MRPPAAITALIVSRIIRRFHLGINIERSTKANGLKPRDSSPVIEA